MLFLNIDEMQVHEQCIRRCPYPVRSTYRSLNATGSRHQTALWGCPGQFTQSPAAGVPAYFLGVHCLSDHLPGLMRTSLSGEDTPVLLGYGLVLSWSHAVRVERHWLPSATTALPGGRGLWRPSRHAACPRSQDGC